ncbi:MAG: hypothetical protein RIT02_1191 [Planctomycetota bacterium]
MLRLSFALIGCVLPFGWSLPPVSGVQQADQPGEVAPQMSADDLQFFESEVRPLLTDHCYECHAGESRILRGGLRLDHRAGWLRGGDSGPAIVPGDPQNSLLMQAVRYESMEMPPAGRLSEQQTAVLGEWIRRGAPDPRLEAPPAKLQPVDWDAARKHWAFQPIPDAEPPAESDPLWSKNPIDRFVRARLRQAGMEPAVAADRRTLIRRATFDLTGLPPTPEETAAFIADPAEDAFDRVVDRLLSSPAYGERWGRHWLDLVRYATTNGADENHGLPEAWRYRDWVIRSLNVDLPMDQFIVQQLAGDLLPVPEDEQAAGDLLTATGLLVLGPKMLAEQDKEKMLIDIADEQVDTISRTMLGLTLSCARCHDHKFDPLSARDYYALAGIFYSTRTMQNRDFVSKWMERPLPSREVTERRRQQQQRIDAVKSELEQLKVAGQKELAAARQAELEKLQKELPQYAMVMAAEEGERCNLPVHLRGNHLKPGPDLVPRGMPSILTEVAPADSISGDESGRLQLARWLVSPQQPLTARVMVNRLWMWHFGRPLMRSPSNWGLQAEAPSHPELLDWLARELMRRGWSLKSMHRLVLSSRTWQMSSVQRADYQELDPENRLLWRQNRRRLEAEEVRDAVLLTGGGLDRTSGGMAGSVDAPRRAIYLPIDRAALYEMFSTFDYVETAGHIEQRPATTVPNQALFLLNSSLVHEQSRRLAEGQGAADVGFPGAAAEELCSRLFDVIYGRPASMAERAEAMTFLQQLDSALSGVADERERRLQCWATLCRTLLAGNQFLFVD